MQLSLQTIFQVLTLSLEAGMDYFLKTSTTYHDYASGNFCSKYFQWICLVFYAKFCLYNMYHNLFENKSRCNIYLTCIFLLKVKKTETILLLLFHYHKILIIFIRIEAVPKNSGYTFEKEGTKTKQRLLLIYLPFQKTHIWLWLDYHGFIQMKLKYLYQTKQVFYAPILHIL